MRLLKEVAQADILSKEVEVAVTLGQLLMIRTVFGKHSTTDVADYLKSNEHYELAGRVKDGELDYELYMEIGVILSEMGVEAV